jgi:glycogen operon protein
LPVPAHAEKVELCLFDRAGQYEQARIVPPEYTDEVWQLHSPEVRDQLYGYRVHGRTTGRRTPPTRTNCLDRPLCQGARRLAVERCGVRLPVGSPREDPPSTAATARHVPKCRVVKTAFT